MGRSIKELISLILNLHVSKTGNSNPEAKYSVDSWEIPGSIRCQRMGKNYLTVAIQNHDRKKDDLLVRAMTIFSKA